MNGVCVFGFLVIFLNLKKEVDDDSFVNIENFDKVIIIILLMFIVYYLKLMLVIFLYFLLFFLVMLFCFFDCVIFEFSKIYVF